MDKILKFDEDKMRVWGWASISIDVNGEVVVDHEGDIIPPEVLEEAAYEYVLKSREGSDRHDQESIGSTAKLITAVVTTPEVQKAMGLEENTLPIGLFVGYQIEDEDVWAEVKKGNYQSFSIGGSGEREEVK